jgi:hypothetical protein
MSEFTRIDDAIPRHRLYYLEERDLELLGVEGMGCPPDPKKVDKYITEELGLDITSPMFKWDVDSLLRTTSSSFPMTTPTSAPTSPLSHSQFHSAFPPSLSWN